MVRPLLDAREAVRRLNAILECDTDALSRLIETRVPCNGRLADHPTVQVRDVGDGYRVGLLGILNGLFGDDAVIVAHMTDGRIERFDVMEDL